MMPPAGPGPGRRSAPEGEPAVFVADEQDAVPVEVGRLASLAEHVLGAEGVGGASELSVYFVDEATITDLNRRYLGGDGSTDVLAFPMEDDPAPAGRVPDGGVTGPDRPADDLAEVPILLGDVVVCPAVAARNAADHGWTTDEELALLVVHGVLHVVGFDHADAAGAAAMGARQREHLAWFDPAGGAGAVPDPEAPPDAGTVPPA